MPESTTYYNMTLFDSVDDKDEAFLDFRDKLAGTGTSSNFNIIDVQMNTNKENIEGLAEDVEYNADRSDENSKYNTTTIDSRVIDITSLAFTQSDFYNIKVNVGSDIVDGTQIQVKINSGTAYNLYSDYDGTEAVTVLDKGVYDFIYREDTTDFFYLAPKGGAVIKSIQRGQFLMSGTSDNITISGIDTESSIIRINHNATTGGADDQLITASIDSSTSITISRYATSTTDITVDWEVVEFNNVKSKQTGYLYVNHNTVINHNDTISEVDPEKSLIFFTKYGSSNTTNDYLTYFLNGSGFNSGTSIYFTTNDGYTSATTRINWQVIEFN